MVSICQNGLTLNKIKNIIPNQKYLALSDIKYIEQEVLQENSFHSVVSTLHNDPTAISKEVRRSANVIPQKSNRDYIIYKNYIN